MKPEDVWTKAERDGISDHVLMSQTWPNELHRAKKTVSALLEAMHEMMSSAMCQNDSATREEEERWTSLLAQLEAK